jgi:type II secretory pathway pseudopilin PulG
MKPILGFMNRRNTLSGIGIFEIVAIIAILALVSVLAIPRLAGQQSGSVAERTTLGLDLAKTAHASAIAQLKRFPTVAELSAFIEGATVAPISGGLELSLKGGRLTVPTYSDSACTRLTYKVDQQVACLGSL